MIVIVGVAIVMKESLDPIKMLGCSIQPSTAAMLKLVVELAVKWHTEVPVPVPIITREP